MNLQLKQAIAASLLDFCCPNGDVEISADLRAQQLKELEYYQQRQFSSWQAPDSIISFAPKTEPQLPSQLQIICQEPTGPEVAKKLHQEDEAATPHEKEEGSQASTTSAEPSLSAPELSGIALAPSACSQLLCTAVSTTLLTDWSNLNQSSIAARC